MSNEKNMPAVSPDEPATDNQINFLKGIGKYKEGMTKEEASDIISLYMKEYQMETGVQMLKVKTIEEAVKADKTPILDSNGNPAVRIIFKGKPKVEKGVCPEISDIFYYAKDAQTPCKSEFKIRNLKKALGLKAEEAQNMEIIKTKKFWGLVQEVHHVDESGNILKDRDENVIMTKNLLAKYFSGDISEPIIEGDPKRNGGIAKGEFLATKVIKAKEGSERKEKEAPAAEKSSTTDTEEWS
jgi:hypothetical protein